MPGKTTTQKARVTYGVQGNFTQLDPAPFVTLEYVPINANDSVIGYEWKCTITGYAVSEIKDGVGVSAESTVDKIRKLIHETFDKSNGGTLFVYYAGAEIIKATGSKVSSIAIESNDNNWINYAKYTVELTFNEVNYQAMCGGSSIALDCDNILLLNYPKNLVNAQKYSVKSFKDGWTFNIGEENNNSAGLLIHNQFMNVSYSIEAEGMHYYTGFDTKTIPAWEQAKIFCQDRLYKQVRFLLTSILPGSNNPIPCNAPFGMNGVYLPSEERSMVDFSVNEDNEEKIIFEVYNETVDTTASEANGTFSVKYNAIVKRKLGGDDLELQARFPGMPIDEDVIHTVTVNRGFANHFGSKKTNLTLSGKIQGLIKRGLWQNPNVFDMNKESNELVEKKETTDTKYDNARKYWDAISLERGRDFIKSFKDYFNITYGTFYVNCSEPTGPRPTTLNHSHDYSEGSIDYSAGFDSEKVCAGKEANFTDVSFVFEDKIENYAEFIIPGRPNGPLVQRLNSFKPRSVTLNITGFTDQKDCCWDFDSYGDGACKFNLIVDGYIPGKNIDNAILTEDNLTVNPVDGSFSVSRKYVYYDREIRS